METPKARDGSSEAPKKVSPRVVRKLKVNSAAFGSSSPASPSTNATRSPKERSPKILERKSPRSPAIPEKKRLSRATELETQITELQDDLKKVKDELTTCRKSKEEAEANAEELKQQLEAVSSNLEDSQTNLSELKGISEEKDQAWENQLEVVRKQQSIDASALTSALDEIETLKQQLEMATRCENEARESTDIELQSLREHLKESLFLLESVKGEIDVCKQAEAKAQELVRETLVQLQEAKRTVTTLRQDDMKATEDSNASKDNLEEELNRAKSAIEELKANLLDKENELQGISEENESLNTKLKKSATDHRENGMEDELERMREEIANLKEDVTEKESELQSIAEENKTLKTRREEEAMEKLEVVMEEAEKSKRRAERASEQLEAAQAGNAELETELRKLKVQSDQWRKAAEAAASMLSSPGGGNGRFVERTGSLDNTNGYSPIAGRRMGSPYLDDYDDEDAFKKKNGNVLRKIGGFWKKPQK